MFDTISGFGQNGNSPGEDGNQRCMSYMGTLAVQLSAEGGFGAAGADAFGSGIAQDGGDGGKAIAAVRDKSYADTSVFFLSVLAYAGSGGNGGNSGTPSGNGGDGGTAYATVQGNSATGIEGQFSTTFGLEASAIGGVGGVGGSGSLSNGTNGLTGSATAVVRLNTITLTDAAVGFRFSASATATATFESAGVASAIIRGNTLTGGDSVTGQTISFRANSLGNIFDSRIDVSDNEVTLGSGNDTVSVTIGEMSGNVSGVATVAANVFSGGTGTDTLVLNLSVHSVTGLTLNLATGLLDFGSGTNRAYGFENVTVTLSNGGTLGATIYGDDQANRLSTSAGNDLLYGRNGDDILIGGAGDDYLNGGQDDDVLEGGAGKDVLDGRSGTDEFVFASAADSTGTGFDTIADANFNQDVFAFSFAVTGVAATQTVASLSDATFEAQLGVAAAGLGGHAAGLFAVAGGGYAGRTFLVVDGDGLGGYTAGNDFVIDVTGYLGAPNLADFVLI